MSSFVESTSEVIINEESFGLSPNTAANTNITNQPSDNTISTMISLELDNFDMNDLTNNLPSGGLSNNLSNNKNSNTILINDIASRYEAMQKKLHRSYQEKNLLLHQLQILRKEMDSNSMINSVHSSFQYEKSNISDNKCDNKSDIDHPENEAAWNKLVETNIRAGTMACLWCMKVQVFKRLSSAFHHWKDVVSVNSSLSESVLLNQRQLNSDLLDNSIVIPTDITPDVSFLLESKFDQKYQQYDKRQQLLNYADRVMHRDLDQTFLTNDFDTKEPALEIPTLNNYQYQIGTLQHYQSLQKRRPRYLEPTLASQKKSSPKRSNSNVIQNNKKVNSLQKLHTKQLSKPSTKQYRQPHESFESSAIPSTISGTSDLHVNILSNVSLPRSNNTFMSIQKSNNLKNKAMDYSSSKSKQKMTKAQYELIYGVSNDSKSYRSGLCR